MTEKKTKTVDEAIEEVVEQEEGGTAGVKDALAKAQKAVDNARSTMQDAYGKARERSHEAAERTKVYLQDAKTHLAEAKEKMGQVATKARSQLEQGYAQVKDQYEAVAVKSKELYGKVRDKVAEVDFKQKGDQVLEYIKTNPGKAVLIALAAGFIVGFATRPRD